MEEVWVGGCVCGEEGVSGWTMDLANLLVPSSNVNRFGFVL